MDQPKFSTGAPPRLIEGLRARVGQLSRQPLEYPIALTLDEAEECIRVLWEFVGHMGDDVGTDGYEFRLLERARHWAHQLQLSVLAAVAYTAPHLISEEETAAGLDLTRTAHRVAPDEGSQDEESGHRSSEP